MQKGFTIIETIVYLALFGLIISGIVVSMYSLYEISGRNQSKAMLQEEKDFLTAKIGLVFDSIDPTKSVSPPANATGVFLSETSYDGTTNSVSLSGGQLLMNAYPLSNTNVTISNLVFIHTYLGGTNPESIEAGFLITEKSSDGIIISQIASTTRYLRK